MSLICHLQDFVHRSLKSLSASKHSFHCLTRLIKAFTACFQGPSEMFSWIKARECSLSSEKQKCDAGTECRECMLHTKQTTGGASDM